MRGEDLLQDYKRRIDLALENLFDNHLARLYKMSPFVREVLDVTRDFTLRGGKRIRPILFITGYLAVGGKKRADILKASLSIEMLHTYFLIHDDIIDRDDLRRGKPSVHKIYESHIGKRKEDPKHIGQSMGILAGDLLSHIGTDIIMRSRFPKEKRILAAQKFNTIAINTVFGELIDVRSSISPTFSEETVNDIHLLKTAMYTIEGPLHLGAILAGAGKKTLDSFSAFALPLGQAFQIKDDVLGLFGTRKAIGKPVTSDISEGKETLLITKALEHATWRERTFLKETFGKKDLSMAELNRVRRIVKSTGAYDYSIDKAEIFVKQGIEQIKRMRIDPQQKKFLIWLAEFIVRRDN